MAGKFDYKNTDYVEVADRLRVWHEQYPDCRIETHIVELSETRVTVKAEVYRSIGDPMPAGVGHSYLAIPGSTPYTKGSELENAETSAVGRALVMAGIPSKNIASGNEVRAKQAPAARASSGRQASEGPAGDAPAPGEVRKPTDGEAVVASPGACAHDTVVTTKPDGKPLPAGNKRCVACGTVFREAS